MRFLTSLRWSIVVLAAVGVLASLMVSSQGFWMQQRMSQNAAQAFVAKDVVADILPPPMYLIEMRLVLSQAIEGTVDLAEAKKQVDRLTSEYQARVDYWTLNPPYGIEKQLLGRQHEAAKIFIAAAQSQVIAKLQSGDADGARQALPEVHKLYLAHRGGVDDTVAAGNAFAASSMAAFSATQKQSRTIAMVVIAAAVALVLLLSRLVLRSIETPVDRCARFARKIATGDLTQRDSQAGARHDAIGALEPRDPCASPTSSVSLTVLRFKPTSWRSMQPLRRPVPASRAVVLQWWPVRYEAWPDAARRLPKKSRT